MSAVEAFLDSLGEEARVAMRALVAQAYERGFREGLSAAGAPPQHASTPVVVAAAAPVAQTPVAHEAARAPTAVPVPHDVPDSSGVNWTLSRFTTSVPRLSAIN